MAMEYGFFNSVNGDREKSAEFFMEFFGHIIGNGIYPNPSTNFQVMANDDMTITVMPGIAWINGTLAFDKFNYNIPIDVADGVLNRIDRVVIRLDTLGREIKIVVKKGIYASTPVAPVLQRDADAYELALADIYVGKGVVGLNQANIKDQRLNTELCGIVHGVVDQIDTTTLFLEYEQWMKDKQVDMNDWLYSNQAIFTQEFYTWFDALQAVFDGSVEANLINEILKVDKKTLQNRTEIFDIKLKLSEANVINFLNKTGIGFYDLFNSLANIDDVMTTANVDVVANNVKFTNIKILKMKPETFESFKDLELNVYDSDRVTVSAMANSANNKLKVLVTPGSIVSGDKFYFNGVAYTVSSVAEGI